MSDRCQTARSVCLAAGPGDGGQRSARRARHDGVCSADRLEIALAEQIVRVELQRQSTVVPGPFIAGEHTPLHERRHPIIVLVVSLTPGSRHGAEPEFQPRPTTRRVPRSPQTAALPGGTEEAIPGVARSDDDIAVTVDA